MGTYRGPLQGGQLEYHQAYHPRHPSLQYHFTLYHVHRLALQPPLRKQSVWYWTPPLEAGRVPSLWAESGVLHPLICSLFSKGLIWLLIATIAEVLPAVCD